MYLKLRVLFTIFSAICLAFILPAGALFGWIWFVIFGGAAVVFFLAMLICKQKQEEVDPLSKIDGNADFINTTENTEE